MSAQSRRYYRTTGCRVGKQFFSDVYHAKLFRCFLNFFWLNYKGIDEAVVFFEMVFGVNTSLQQKVKDAQLPFFSVGIGTPSDLEEIDSCSQFQHQSLCIASSG